MIALKCPQCGQTAEAPEEVVRSSEKCYRCHVPLVIADPRVAHRRRRQFWTRAFGVVGGGLLGSALLVLLALYGGPAGVVMVTAVGGGVIGLGVGLGEGLIAGLEWALLFQEAAWLKKWPAVFVLLGAGLGVLLVASGAFPNEEMDGTLLGLGAMGGLLLGGTLGYWLVQRLDRAG